MNMNKSRTNIRTIVEHIEPLDALERATIAKVLAWIDGGAELFRRVKPDVPNQHLVSYFVLVDGKRSQVLLVNHRKAGLWLPTGGHVELDEDPHETVKREFAEELGLRAASEASIGSLPLMITTNVTNGDGRHTDVCLWYVVAGDVNMELDPDPGEFIGHRWWTFDEVLAADIGGLDPATHRFLRKLQGRF